MKHTLITIIITALLTAATITARTYHSVGYTPDERDTVGIAWDWGGFDILPHPVLFVCSGAYNFASDTFTPNPLLPYINPSLIADC